MTPTIALMGLLAAAAGALKPLQHVMYALHILWSGGIAWLLMQMDMIPSEFDQSAIAPLFMVHLAVINMVTFMAYGFDKYAAQRGGWRIPEKTLHCFMFIGGNAGAHYGSKLFRHKTRKESFRQMVLVVNIVQILVLCALFFVL